MKNTVIIVVVALLLLIGVGVFLVMRNTAPLPVIDQPNNEEPVVVPGATTQRITVGDFTFIPKSLSIKRGDTIVWANIDTVPHTVVSDSGTEISSPSLAKGEEYSHTFNIVGTYEYHCSIHPGMKGTIVVD